MASDQTAKPQIRHECDACGRVWYASRIEHCPRCPNPSHVETVEVGVARAQGAIMADQTALPRMDETWRAKSGRTRHVTFVQHENDLQDGGRWCLVHYTRPPPAQEQSAVVTLKQWREWVNREQAFRITKTWRAA